MRKALLVSIAYFIWAMVARIIKHDPFCVSFIWPGTGLLLGALLVSDRREWLPLMLAVLPADYLFDRLGFNPPFALWLALRIGSYGAIWLGAMAVVRLCRGLPKLESVREVMIVLMVGGILCQLMVNAVIYGLISVTFMGSPTAIAPAASWWGANMSGILFMVPAILIFYNLGSAKLRAVSRAPKVEIFIVVAAYCFALSHRNDAGWVGAAALQASTAIMIMWAALRLGVVGIAVINPLLILITSLFPILPQQWGVITGSAALGGDIFHAGAYISASSVSGVLLSAISGLLLAVAIESHRYGEGVIINSNQTLERALGEKAEQAAELQSTNALLQKVLVRSEALGRDLLRANEVLTASDRAKLEFVRTLSHELRNPIAGARMMADSLLRAPVTSPTQRQVEHLKACVQYLQTLLDETMDLTQVESGQIAVKLETFHAAELFSEAAAMFHSVAEQKHLVFAVAPPAGATLMLIGDKTHTKRILINYLSNAFKFTEAGRVELRSRLVAHDGQVCRLRFEVSDTGPGISPAVQARLFTKFVRESSRVEGRDMLGAGLGLALCKELAELAGGAVGCTTAAGLGSTFWAELPFIVGPESAGEERSIARPEFGNLAAAVIDDDPLQLEIMTAILEQFGVIAETARTPEAALQLLDRKKFDVVFVDYHVGSQTGVQILEKHRQQPEGMDGCTQFHLVTAHWDEGVAAAARTAGFHDSHTKPLGLVQLYRILVACH